MASPREKPWLMGTDGGAASSYSRVAGKDGAGDEEKVFEWEQLGEPLFVFSYTAMVVGRQCIALSLLALQVFSTRVQKMLQQDNVKSYLMDCDEEAVGFTQSCICETTKAFVRCFPPVSIIVAFVVASQLILCQRLFYVMIRSGVLVDFKNLEPLKDPLFWWVLVNGAFAMSHFVFHLLVVEQMHIGKDNLHKIIDSLKQDAIFFGLPSVLYVVFLYMSYDVEWLLLPLSKFWEADPEWAERTSSEMAFVPERAAAQAKLTDDAACIQDVADSVALQSLQRGNMVQANALPRSGTVYVPEKRAEKLRQKVNQSEHQAAPRTYFLQRAWISRLLSNSKLVSADQKSRTFYYSWLCWMLLTSFMCLAAVGVLIMQLKNDIEDIIHGHGEEYLCVAIIGSNVIIMVIVVYFYVADLLFP